MKRIDTCEDANGIRIHYVREGDGPLVLLLHGWPSYSYAWRKVIPLLSSHYTVVAPDIRGYGLSDKPEGPYDKRTMATDMADLVKKLGFDRVAAVVGHDRGGRVGHRLGIDYPGLVEKMVLIDMLPTRDMLRNMDLKLAIRAWHWFLHLQPDLPELFLMPNLKAYVAHFFQHAYNRAALEESLDHYVEILERPGTMRAVLADYRMTFGQDMEDDEKAVAAGVKLTMPVLMLWGEKGIYIDKERMLAAWSPYATDVRTASIPRCGYYMHEEAPEAMAEQLMKFFKEG